MIHFCHHSFPYLSLYMKVKDPSPDSSVECSSALPYPTQGGLCLEDTLLSMNCDTGESLLVLHDDEMNARLLIPALRQIPSLECRAAAIPLLCMYLFGLCDSSGVNIQPTSGQCRNIRDNLCSVEWQTAIMLGLDLPECEIFPEEQLSCSDNVTGSGNVGKGSYKPK